MNSCNGHGTCFNGFCSCNAGYTGADCSAKYVSLTNGYQHTTDSIGIKWFYYVYSGTEKFNFIINSENKILDVYLSANPNKVPT